MIVLILLLCLCNMASAVPVSSNAAPPLEALPSQKMQSVDPTEPQTQAPVSPIVEQPQPSSPPLPSAQLLPPVQQYPWSPLGGNPLMFPFQPNLAGSQPANQPALPLQPMMFPPFGYMPFFPSPYTNQLFSPYRFPEAPLPQTPANQAPNVLPAETSLGAAPVGEAAAAQTQQQNPPIVYMLQQPMNSQLGGLSSEELQIAAKMSQLGVYMPTVLNNPGSGAVQPLSHAAGITNQERAEGVSGVGLLPAGVQLKQGLSGGSGGTPCSNNLPAGLHGAAPKANAPGES